MKIRLGFTGTQSGMTDAQQQKFIQVVSGFDIAEFHHGDCIGADAHAHNLVLPIGGLDMVIHPPINEAKRAFCNNKRIPDNIRMTVLAQKEYLVRNHDIVDRSTVLIATPGESKEKLRSGTWSTIRYARKCNRQVIVILPDGSLQN
jgi:hypothetical protein